MFKKNNDDINKYLINMSKSKVKKKYELLNNKLHDKQYIFKDLPIDDTEYKYLNNSLNTKKTNVYNQNDILNICYNTNKYEDFCNELIDDNSRTIDKTYNLKTKRYKNLPYNIYNNKSSTNKDLYGELKEKFL